MREFLLNLASTAFYISVASIAVYTGYLLIFSLGALYYHGDPLPSNVAEISYQEAMAIRIGWAQVMVSNIAVFLSLLTGMLIIYSTKVEGLTAPMIVILLCLYITAASYVSGEWQLAYREASIAVYQAEIANGGAKKSAEVMFQGRRLMGGVTKLGLSAGVFLPAWLFMFAISRRIRERKSALR